MLKATLEGDEGEEVMLPRVVHWLVLQGVQVFDSMELEY